MKYEFHVGDYVETKNGAKGYIIRVEGPWWRCTEGKNKCCKDFDYIVASIEEDIIVKFYSRIGQYDFTKKDKIEPLKKSWTLTNDVDGKGEYYFDSREVIKKINELAEAVNRLEGKVNGMV